MFAAFGGTLFAETLEKVIVQGSKVNIRAKGADAGEVVGQAEYGEMLMAKAFGEEWVEVQAPDRISMWVHSEFLHNDTVKVPRLNVRAGSSVNYSIVGRLDRDTAVTRRSTFNEWVEISPPAICSVFIHKDYVKRAPKSKPPVVVKQVPKKVVAPVKVQPKPRVVAVKPVAVKQLPLREIAPPPPTYTPHAATRNTVPIKATGRSEVVVVAPDDLKLIPLEGQGKVVEREGILKSYLFAGSAPSRFQLRASLGGDSQTVCYVRKGEQSLKEFVGKRVVIRGHEYWIEGQSRPVLMPKAIIAVED